MRVEDRDEPDDDAGDGQQVEHGVKQLVPDPTAAATRSVEQHRWKERKRFFDFTFSDNKLHLKLRNICLDLQMKQYKDLP